ncbi:hypothetical protein AMTRI_Chr07g75300 [Amborella trichopoda]
MIKQWILKSKEAIQNAWPCSRSRDQKRIMGCMCITHGQHRAQASTQKDVQEDSVTVRFERIKDSEIRFFGVFDGRQGCEVQEFLVSHLFNNIVNEPEFWTRIKEAVQNAFVSTDKEILSNTRDHGRGGSAAVTALVINNEKMVVANVGDSRAVLCKNSKAIQLSTDHKPIKARQSIEKRGGRGHVDGELDIARAFRFLHIKPHMTSDPHVEVIKIDAETEFLILATNGIWQVMNNQEAVNLIGHIKDPQEAAECLAKEAEMRMSKDDISCIIVRFG